MYRNIVFDLGGVVVDYDPKEFLLNLFFHEKTEDKLYSIVFESKEYALLEKGEISWDAACKVFLKNAKKKGVGFEMQALLDEWSNIMVPKNATIVLMRLLRKKRYRVFYVSNTTKVGMEKLEKEQFWPLFNGGMVSYEADSLKPEPGIFEALMAKYRLSPSETIYIDDEIESVQTAIELGIAGLEFSNVKNLCRDMVEFGITV